MLAFLPLQFSWAAIAVYCEHETVADAGHVGHHEHVHQGDAKVAADASASADKGPGALDLDCGQCHGHQAGTAWRKGELPARLSSEQPDRDADEAVDGHASARPERPQWAPLA